MICTCELPCVCLTSVFCISYHGIKAQGELREAECEGVFLQSCEGVFFPVVWPLGFVVDKRRGGLSMLRSFPDRLIPVLFTCRLSRP